MSIHSIDNLLAKRGGPATVQRLRWIEAKLFWSGEMSRSDLMKRFAISASQASLDLASYRDVAPGNLVLDHADKRLKAAEPFEPVFAHDARAWVEEERQAGTEAIPDCVRAGDPWTSAPTEVVRAMMRAASNRSCVSVLYASLSSGSSERRLLSPHTIVDVGDRLHARAFDHGKLRFADFVLARMDEPEHEGAAQWVDGSADADWNEEVSVDLEPDPDLGAAQAATAMREIGLDPGGGRLTVRRALAFYLLERIGFVGSSPGRYACTNYRELAAAIRLPTRSEGRSR
jgi:transposase